VSPNGCAVDLITAQSSVSAGAGVTNNKASKSERRRSWILGDLRLRFETTGAGEGNLGRVFSLEGFEFPSVPFALE
jgi:hypothetical protein